MTQDIQCWLGGHESRLFNFAKYEINAKLKIYFAKFRSNNFAKFEWFETWPGPSSQSWPTVFLHAHLYFLALFILVQFDLLREPDLSHQIDMFHEILWYFFAIFVCKISRNNMTISPNTKVFFARISYPPQYWPMAKMSLWVKCLTFYYFWKRYYKSH
jgi:hypothetical protein